MESNQSTEHVTVLPADLYDELATDAPAEPSEALREAAARAREVVVQR
jgi:hypothetical protein